MLCFYEYTLHCIPLLSIALIYDLFPYLICAHTCDYARISVKCGFSDLGHLWVALNLHMVVDG